MKTYLEKASTRSEYRKGYHVYGETSKHQLEVNAVTRLNNYEGHIFTEGAPGRVVVQMVASSVPCNLP